jgi:hypothetical protein
MIAGAIALLLGLAFQPLGQVVGWVAWVFLTYTIEAVRLTARASRWSLPRARPRARWPWEHWSAPTQYASMIRLVLSASSSSKTSGQSM